MKEKIILVGSHGLGLAQAARLMIEKLGKDVEIKELNEMEEEVFTFKAQPKLAEITETYCATRHQKKYLPLPKKSWKKKLKR